MGIIWYGGGNRVKKLLTNQGARFVTDFNAIGNSCFDM